MTKPAIATHVDVEGRSVRLTNLGKVLWPAAGFTKRQMIAYYAAAAAAIIPHLARRPVTLKRFPDGVDGPFWFQTDCPRRPDWVETTPVPSSGGDRLFHQCVIGDTAALLWSANLGTVEYQPALWTIDRPDDASFVVFDLDPGEGADLGTCCAVAVQLEERLGQGLGDLYVKTSGRKGLHVYLPQPPGTPFDEAKRLARACAAELAHAFPDRVTDDVAVHRRRGRVLIDWRQTSRLRQVCCPYSLRATVVPNVSMPLTWDEVASAARSGDGSRLFFTPGEALDRFDLLGDLFAPLQATHHSSEG